MALHPGKTSHNRKVGRPRKVKSKKPISAKRRLILKAGRKKMCANMNKRQSRFRDILASNVKSARARLSSN